MFDCLSSYIIARASSGVRLVWPDTSAATFNYFKITFNNNYFVVARMAVLRNAAACIFAFLCIFLNFIFNLCYVKGLLMIHYLYPSVCHRQSQGLAHQYHVIWHYSHLLIRFHSAPWLLKSEKKKIGLMLSINIIAVHLHCRINCYSTVHTVCLIGALNQTLNSINILFLEYFKSE